MQLARASIVVKPVRHVGVLLDFADRETRADSVNGSGWNVEDVTRFDIHPIEELLDFAVERGFP
jgi:hypothetical protein